MKSKILVSSILTIVLCLSLIVGSTFALFTDETEFNIAVTSGDVEILATAGIKNVYSAVGTDGTAGSVYLVDEKLHNYVHAEQTLVKDSNNKVIKGTFSNGGVAYLDGANLEIERITPGDRVDVNVCVENKSNVAIVYRYKIEATDSGLAKGMVVSIGSNNYEGLSTWTSEWYPVVTAPDGTPGEIAPLTITFQLPVDADNTYQSEEGAEKSVSYTITVEAVQGNAVTDDESQVTYFS